MARSRTFQKISRVNKAEADFKDRIDLLRSRVGLLAGRDRALMQIYLDNSGTFSQMAKIAGVNESNIARRIHKLVRRLLDGQYITCQSIHRISAISSSTSVQVTIPITAIRSLLIGLKSFLLYDISNIDNEASSYS